MKINDNWEPDDGCPKCYCPEMMAGEITQKDNKIYKVWRCGECGKEAQELLSEINAFGRLMDYLWIKDETEFDEFLEEDLLLEKGIDDFHAIVEESISETLRQMTE